MSAPPIDKTYFLNTVRANFNAARDAMIEFGYRRCRRLSDDLAEQIVAEALWRVPLRMAYLKHGAPIDWAVLRSWLDEFDKRRTENAD